VVRFKPGNELKQQVAGVLSKMHSTDGAQPVA
jgi:hypothetical protein